ncbi:hypothetical protein SAMD00019534_074800 [Acytostelium subglobosum LB1]|uniref:hypothetical protein n=1 Tax=Acytostelium subglobosum LB1 TaxID=1410327 RepID=UPI000644F324|nr:hypothetical protein SAMD00019534_074800 [Acytostelium subglobosum LB1]GAM24305.1 hypothetical protein SAMD00019534_074800 [Acytostelium subglobosum LB1]|eukprot:XP_012752631.1 hypothetical protein SAMD00019534_074800 [Acytostelium subglobosum LB1]
MVYQFQRSNYQYLLPIRTLRLFVAGLVTFLVIPLVSLWSISFNCQGGYIIHFPKPVTCYSGLNLVTISLSIISLLILVPYSAITCSTYFEMDPHVKNTFSRMNARLNQLRTALMAVCLWAAVCLMIVLQINNAKDIRIMYIFFGGIIPAFLIGAAAIELRRMYLAKRVRDFQKNVLEDGGDWKPFLLSIDYEIASRYIIGNPLHKSDDARKKREQGIELMSSLYAYAYKLTPRSHSLLKSYCYFTKIFKKDQVQANALLESLKALNPRWDINFFVYHQERARERTNETAGFGPNPKMQHFMAYVQYKRLGLLSRKFHLNTLRCIHKFWSIAASKNASEFAQLSRQSAAITRNESRANRYYKRLLEMHPNSSRILRDYAIFVEDVLKDSDKAKELLDRAAKIDEENSVLSHPPLPTSSSANANVMPGATPSTPSSPSSSSSSMSNEIELEPLPVPSPASGVLIRSGDNNDRMRVMAQEEEETTLENLPEHSIIPKVTGTTDPLDRTLSNMSSQHSTSSNSLNSSQRMHRFGEIEPTLDQPPILDGKVAAVAVPVETKADQEIRKRNQPVRRLNYVLILATGLGVLLMMAIFTHLFVRLQDQTYAVTRLRITGSYVTTASNIAFYMRSAQVAAQAYAKNPTVANYNTTLNQTMTLWRRSVQLMNLHNAIYYGERTIVNYDRDHYKLVTGRPVTTGIDTGARIFLESDFNKTKYEVLPGSEMYEFYHAKNIQTYTLGVDGALIPNDSVSLYDVIPQRVQYGIDLSQYPVNSSYWTPAQSDSDPNFQWVTVNTKNVARSLVTLFFKWKDNTIQLERVLMLVNIGISIGVLLLILVFNIFMVRPIVNKIVNTKIEVLGAFRTVPKDLADHMANLHLKRMYQLEAEMKQHQPNKQGHDSGLDTPTLDSGDTPGKPSKIQFADSTYDESAPTSPKDMEKDNDNTLAITHDNMLKKMKTRVSRSLHRRYIVAEVIVGFLILGLLVSTSAQMNRILVKTNQVYYAEGQAAYIRMILYYGQEIIYNPVMREDMQTGIGESVAGMEDDYHQLKQWRNNDKMDGPDFYYNTRGTCLRKLDPCLKEGDKYYDIIEQGLDVITLNYFSSGRNLSANKNATELTPANYYWGYIKMQSKEDLYDGTDNYAYEIGDQLVNYVQICSLSTIVQAVLFSFFIVIIYFIFFLPFVRQLQFESQNTVSMLNMLPKEQ